MKLVVATRNAGKWREIQAILEAPGLEVLSLRDFPKCPEVVEDGATYLENARKKARAVAEHCGDWALADDSGLEVDALGGRPGVRSARFAHERATDAENNAALLRALEEAERGHERAARFRCVLALASPWLAEVKTSEGRIEGTIARDPRGSGGFGYDPLFLATEAEGRAMAELTEAEKNCISHRARAVRALRPVLISVMNLQLDEAERISG